MNKDIFNLTFTGNLTKDAIVKEFPEKGKKVYNFVVACNISVDNTQFLECSYWLKLKTKEESEENAPEVEHGQGQDKLLEALKKGKAVTVYSNYITISSNEKVTEEKISYYRDLKITATRVKL